MYRGHRAVRNWGARVQQITLAGLPAIVLENELLRVTVLTGKGADITEFCYKPRDMDFTWLAPRAMPSPADMLGSAHDDAAVFFDSYAGGWQEILPNGGAPCRYRGAALAQHDEVAKLPWDAEIITDEAAEVAVTFTVRASRVPLRLRKTFRLRAGRAALFIEEDLVNESPVRADAMWGHHVVFGAPFLRPGCLIRLPGGISVIPHAEAINPPERRVAPGGPWAWPEVPAPGGGTVDLSVAPEPGTASDMVYLTGFGDDAWYEITGPAEDLGLRVRWDGAILPYLWLWQECGAWTDYPWWGMTYVTGLEPFSSYPTNGLADAVANGTALSLDAHAHRTLWLETGVKEVR